MRLIGAVLLCCLLAGAGQGAERPERLDDFDIGAQTLSSALLRFSGQSGIQVLAADAPLADQRVRGVRGRMSASAALRALLAGTGFSFRYVDADTIVLVRGGEANAPPRQVAQAPSPAEAEEHTDAEPQTPADVPDLTTLEEVQITGTRIQVHASSDPFGHGVRDAPTRILVPMREGQSYNVVLLQAEQQGGAGAQFKWIAAMKSLLPDFDTAFTMPPVARPNSAE